MILFGFPVSLGIFLGGLLLKFASFWFLALSWGGKNTRNEPKIPHLTAFSASLGRPVSLPSVNFFVFLGFLALCGVYLRVLYHTLKLFAFLCHLWGGKAARNPYISHIFYIFRMASLVTRGCIGDFFEFTGIIRNTSSSFSRESASFLFLGILWRKRQRHLTVT